jgi:uncharacterized membrane protein
MIRIYAKRLERDLKRWHDKGWVTGEGYQAILAEQAQGAKLTASAALAVIGAVLLGFAAISFVAANWNEIPRLLRVSVLVAALWTAYGGAAYFYERGLPDFAQAAVLSGALFFGAAVMLITQMYHISSGNLPGFMLLWTAGAAVAGILFRSSLTLAAAMILASAWNVSELDIAPHAIQWHFLPVWAALTALLAWNRTGLGLHTAAAVLTVWLVRAEFEVSHAAAAIATAAAFAAVFAAAHVYVAAGNALVRQIAFRAMPYAMIVCFGGLVTQPLSLQVHIPAAAVGIVACIAVATRMLSQTDARWQQAAPPLFSFALPFALYSLFVIQFHTHIELSGLIVAAVSTFAVLAGALICGIQARSPLVMWLAYAGLVTEMLWLYFDKLGNLINTSLFFLLMGAAIFALARVLMRHGGASHETEVRS